MISCIQDPAVAEDLRVLRAALAWRKPGPRPDEVSAMAWREDLRSPGWRSGRRALSLFFVRLESRDSFRTDAVR